MIYKTKKLHNLKPLAIIIAISTFFFFSFTSSPLACSHINVTTNLEAATFTLYGMENFSGSGTRWHIVTHDGGTKLTYGTFEIVYGDVEGYITPPSETKYLPPLNGLIAFNGIYVYEYESGYGYSVTIASGDVNGDGIDEIITGAGPRPNASDEIMVTDEYGEYLFGFRADTYDRYGVNVAGGDIDGDGVAEIVAGTGPGPHNEAFVQIFDAYGEEKAYFMVLDTKYGANIAVGNLGLEAHEEVEDVDEDKEAKNKDKHKEVEDKDKHKEDEDELELRDVIVETINEILDKGQEPSYTDIMVTYMQVKNVGLTDLTYGEFEAMFKRYAAEDESAYIELVAYAGSNAQKRALLRHYKETMSEKQYQSIYWQLFQEGHISWNFLEEEE